MKALFASLFVALFALISVSSHAAVPASTGTVYESDDSKDEAKSPTTGTEQKDEDDKKKEDEDKKS